MIKSEGIRVSMDGKGRWIDNVFIERLLRSLKDKKTRLWSFEAIPELERHIREWIDHSNHRRKTPTIEVSNTLGSVRSLGKNGRISAPQTNLHILRDYQIA